MLAVIRKHLLCAQFLIAFGGDPNIANMLGETALYKGIKCVVQIRGSVFSDLKR